MFYNKNCLGSNGETPISPTEIYAGDLVIIPKKLTPGTESDELFEQLGIIPGRQSKGNYRPLMPPSNGYVYGTK